jgi:adenosylhomocysteinase
MESFERARLEAYFGRVVQHFAAADRPSAFLVTHLLPERPSFVRAVASLVDLR